MTDYARLAADIVEAFERGEFETTWERHAIAYIRGKSGPGARMWWPTLDGMVGASRRITQTMQIGYSSARVVLTGDAGEAVVTLLFDDDGKVCDIGVTDWPLVFGIRNIQIDCPGGTVPAIAALYAALLGQTLPPPDGPNWVVLGDKPPRLPFAGQAPNWKPASWDDPDRQQQVHLELFVRDMSEAKRLAEANGAVQVADDVWADQGGHAIRMVPGESGDGPAVIGRVVLDAPDPRALAAFYEELLVMTRFEDAADRVVITRDDGRLPMLAFRRVPRHEPPRWPDPEYPQQMHMDITFDDYHGAQQAAERMGATHLGDLDGLAHPAVYADPAGHPFCLGFPGQ